MKALCYNHITDKLQLCYENVAKKLKNTVKRTFCDGYEGVPSLRGQFHYISFYLPYKRNKRLLTKSLNRRKIVKRK